MADEGQQTIVVSTETFRAQAIADSKDAAAKTPMTDTVPGGAFIVGGVWVDANGNEIKDEDIEQKVLKARSATAPTTDPVIPQNLDMEPALSQSDPPVNRENLAPVEGVVDESMTVPELTDQARRDGIDLTNVKNKTELVARMNEHYAANREQ